MTTLIFKNKSLVQRKVFLGKIETHLAQAKKAETPPSFSFAFRDIVVVHANPLHDCVEGNVDVTMETKEGFAARFSSPIEGFRFGSPFPEEFNFASNLELNVTNPGNPEESQNYLNAITSALVELGYSKD